MIHDLLHDFSQNRWAMEPERLRSLAKNIALAVRDPRAVLEMRKLAAETCVAEEKVAAPRAAAGEGPLFYGTHVKQGALAVWRVGGVIVGKDPWWARYDPKGFTSTARLESSIYAAAADKEVRGGLMMMDSPGGTISGVAGVAEAMRVFRAAGKDFHVHAPDLMASAGYWMGAQASRITIGSAAAVGSIGVYTLLFDYSKAIEEEGITVHLVKAGEHKAAGHGYVAIDAPQLAVVQAEIDAYHAEFIRQALVQGRGMKAEAAKAVADGRVHIGQANVDLGLADAVESTVSVYGRLIDQYSAGGQRARAAVSRVPAARRHITVKLEK